MGERRLYCDYCKKVHLHNHTWDGCWECNCCGSLRRTDGTPSLNELEGDGSVCPKCEEVGG